MRVARLFSAFLGVEGLLTDPLSASPEQRDVRVHDMPGTHGG